MRHGNGAGTGDLTIAGPLSKDVTCGDSLDISHSQAVPQAQDWHAQRKAAEQTIAALADLFPAFVANRWEPHRPLARGIHRQLIDRGILRPEECRLVIGLYVARPMYQRALSRGGPRVNLAGNPTETQEVTAEEMACAAASVARHEARAIAKTEAARAARQAAYAERKRAKKQAVTPSPPPDGTALPRDGLADLKAAAAARKGAPNAF